MKRDWKSKFWRSGAQCFLGAIGLALVTFVCFRFGLKPAAAGFAYLIFMALLALLGSFIGSVILSVAAAGCLQYFFAPPIFNFRMDAPEDAHRRFLDNLNHCHQSHSEGV